MPSSSAGGASPLLLVPLLLALAAAPCTGWKIGDPPSAPCQCPGGGIGSRVVVALQASTPPSCQCGEPAATRVLHAAEKEATGVWDNGHLLKPVIVQGTRARSWKPQSPRYAHEKRLRWCTCACVCKNCVLRVRSSGARPPHSLGHISSLALDARRSPGLRAALHGRPARNAGRRRRG